MNYIKLNRSFGILTIASVFLLLIAGGVVRSTGSGMGCPDWPKCYGLFFPPTCQCELPANYQETFTNKRVQKAEKFANLLKSLGFSKQAQTLLNDPNLKQPEIFNPLKAWTEYVNRLIGVLSGLFSLVFFISLLKIKKTISAFRFWTGSIGFVLMLFNAWLGSIVVATNLFPILISIHYLAAYAVLSFFMFSINQSRIDEQDSALVKYRWYYLIFVVLSLVQLVIGTQLREVSDRAMKYDVLHINGEVNFDYLGKVFQSHWFMSILLILFSLIPIVFLRKKISKKWLKLIIGIPLVLVIQYFSGIVNLKYSFPLIPQVSHIFFAGIIFGISLYICIVVFKPNKSLGKSDRF